MAELQRGRKAHTHYLRSVSLCLWHKTHHQDIWGEIGLRTGKVLFAEGLFYLPVSIMYWLAIADAGAPLMYSQSEASLYKETITFCISFKLPCDLYGQSPVRHITTKQTKQQRHA